MLDLMSYEVTTPKPPEFLGISLLFLIKYNENIITVSLGL